MLYNPRSNVIQGKEPPQWNPHPQWVWKCYNCNKPRHFAAKCYQLRKTQGRQAYIQDYMDQDKDMLGVQEAVNLANLLNNALKVFNTLPLKQKDTLISKYEGNKENFAAAWLDRP